MKKYYVEKSAIDEQPDKNGPYFTNLGRLWFQTGVPGKWFQDNSQRSNMPIWYLEEVTDPVVVLNKNKEEKFMELCYDKTFEKPSEVLDWLKNGKVKQENPYFSLTSKSKIA